MGSSQGIPHGVTEQNSIFLLGCGIRADMAIFFLKGSSVFLHYFIQCPITPKIRAHLPTSKLVPATVGPPTYSLYSPQVFFFHYLPLDHGSARAFWSSRKAPTRDSWRHRSFFQEWVILLYFSYREQLYTQHSAVFVPAKADRNQGVVIQAEM